MTTPTAPADPPAGGSDPEGQRIHSLDEMNSRIGRIETALSRVLPGSHGEAQQRTEQRLDRGSSVEEQVQAELKRAREQEKKQADEAAAKQDHESVKARLAKLEETPPAQEARRATRLLGWGQ